MKTWLLSAFFCVAAFGGYAQNKSCTCKKVTHYKSTHGKVASNKPATGDSWNRTYIITAKAEQPCFTYRKHNIEVVECPGTFYDNSDINGFEFESSYMGNYPQKVSAQGEEAPQHNVIDNYNGVAPAGGNGCNHDCTSW